MTQIDCVIIRITHILKKLLEYFSGLNYPFVQLQQKKNELQNYPWKLSIVDLFPKNKSIEY